MKVSFDILCLDERDSPNLAELTNKSVSEIKAIVNRRHFGLVGVIIPGATYPDINMEGRRIQSKCHGINCYKPFHYVDILNNKAEYAFLGSDQPKRQSLVDGLNTFVKENKFKIIASFIDKQKLALEYGVFVNRVLTGIRKIKPNMMSTSTPRRINLYELALKNILMEYLKYLKDKKKRGIIIAEGRGKAEDQQLLDAFYKYQRIGVSSLSGKELRSYIVDLLVVYKSQNHLGIQLADLITYPLYDYKVPDHNVRKDHFVKEESLERKILNVKVFPN